MVAVHFLLSSAILAAAVTLHARAGEEAEPAHPPVRADLRIRSERPAFDLHYPHIKTGRASRGLEQAIPEPVGNKSVPGQP
jgi:hypothetical protein